LVAKADDPFTWQPNLRPIAPSMPPPGERVQLLPSSAPAPPTV